MNKLIADVIIDVSHGDCGKGKITNSLLKTGEYTHCIKGNGGHNSGHTIIHNGKKIVTHVVPAGVLQGIKSVIGCGCVVSPRMLSEEIEELEKAGINVKNNLFIDKRAHIITGAHLYEDRQDTKIGTTKRGTGPAYRDKYARKGLRYEEVERSEVAIIDLYEELFNNTKDVVALFEGSQGFYLDVDWGDYPYVTSSHCTTAGAMLNGIPPKSIRKVIGASKAYDTYVGAKKFQPDGLIFEHIRKVGHEFGATTGRPRQVNFLNLPNLIKAVRVNGVTDLIVNKTDVLQEINCWKVIVDDKPVDLYTENNFKKIVEDTVRNNCPTVEQVKFSYSPDAI